MPAGEIVKRRLHALVGNMLHRDAEPHLEQLAVEMLLGLILRLTNQRSPRHEFIDLDCALALDCDGLKLFGLDLDVLPFTDFVALDDVG